MTRALAIVNPVAGGGRAARVWAGLDLGVECVATECAGHATTLARQAAEQGVERVVAVGGDGTVSEVADGLSGTETTLAIVPTGAGNDFSRALGVPRRASAAAALALDGAPRRVDVGWVTIGARRRLFVNVAGCGFDAEVVRRLGSAPRGGAGALVYLVGVLRTLVTFEPRLVRLELDGQLVERHALGVAVANGPRYGGGLRIAPRAVLDDGLLDVCVVGGLSAAGILGLLPLVYIGAHARYPGVEFFQCRELRIDGSATCQADGELVGDLPAAFSIQPLALSVVAP